MNGRNTNDTKSRGRFAYDGLDRLLHEKARLGILTSLATHPDGVLFPDLKQHCVLTDGNLSRHLGALVEAGVVETWKRQGDGRPQTLCKLTPAGRARFLEYIAELEHVVSDALTAGEQADALRPGYSPA